MSILIKGMDMPTIDIVRCEECKYWDGIECQNDRASTDLEGGAEYALYRYDTDFCSYGERKGGDNMRDDRTYITEPYMSTSPKGQLGE